MPLAGIAALQSRLNSRIYTQYVRKGASDYRIAKNTSTCMGATMNHVLIRKAGVPARWPLTQHQRQAGTPCQRHHELIREAGVPAL